MVFFRDDVLKKMQRHALFPPSDPDMDITEHVRRVFCTDECAALRTYAIAMPLMLQAQTYGSKVVILLGPLAVQSCHAFYQTKNPNLEMNRR